MKIVFIGLSITSSWGNGHATTYRALVRELVARGHDVLFLERDVPWYAANRDLPQPPWGRTELYADVDDLKARFAGEVGDAEAVIVGSYVPDGVAVGRWAVRTARGVKAFYDIDTPVTLAKLQRGDWEYLSPDLIPAYDLYLSFSGGPTLQVLEDTWHSPRARALYCSVDETLYYPDDEKKDDEMTRGGSSRHLVISSSRHLSSFALGYLGTYSDDRQPTLEALLLEVARREPERDFVVAGPQYPEGIAWPGNVARIEHLPPAQHRAFYNAGQWTLNVTRADMIRAGYSPSVRLFEAAACGVPIVSDVWAGIEELFEPNREIILARTTDEVQQCLQMGETERRAMGQRARDKVLGAHTARHRAAELEALLVSRSLSPTLSKE